uniref:FH2 domain containing 3 n=1 Tax=Nothobranchius furzeri TaxID=105023 RepID=A0A8C6VPZ6_NOTFU
SGDFPPSTVRPSMKKLNWDTIPSHHVVGKLNVWTSQRSQRDLVLDIQAMEELFSHADKRASVRSSRGLGLRKKDGTDLCAQDPQVQMMLDVSKKLLSFRGNLSTLPEADQFMVKLVKVPGYGERLKAMVLREEFFPAMEEVKNAVCVLTKAANELLDCDDLHSVIRLVLKAGNYMNAGGYSANAIGFRMTSLLKLADTKANKPGMNLMHYVAKQAEDIDTELLMFPKKLLHIGMASRICKDDVVADFTLEVQKIKEVQMFSSRQPGLLQQMEQFLQRAEAKLAEVETFLQELKTLSFAVADFFCEDPAVFKLEECCSIFHSFCKRFDTAVKENREREAAEERHKRTESFRIASKRHSTSSCSVLESNEEPACLESALHSLLVKVPDGLSRSRRNLALPRKGALSSSSSQKAEGKTSCMSQESPEKKQPKLLEQDQENLKEAEKMREITRKVLKYQNSKGVRDDDAVKGSPRRSETKQDGDYVFNNNGKLGSPWTILSPLTSRKRQTRRSSSSSSENDLDDRIWDSDEEKDSSLDTCSGNSSSSQSGGTVSLPEYFRRKALSQARLLRSASVNETSRSPATGFRLGYLFQRSTRTGSRGEGGFTSFLKRIGGRNKLDDLEEQNFRGSNT